MDAYIITIAAHTHTHTHTFASRDQSSNSATLLPKWTENHETELI